MSNISREEVKEMIDDRLKTLDQSIQAGVYKALDKKMSDYNIGPQHWVFLEAEYNRALARRSTITKVVVTTVVTFICAITVFGAEYWIKRTVIDHYKDASP